MDTTVTTKSAKSRESITVSSTQPMERGILFASIPAKGIMNRTTAAPARPQTMAKLKHT